MIDLTNKNVNEINALIQKYANVIQMFKPQEQPYFAYIIEIASNHIKESHINIELSPAWKSWSVFVVVKKVAGISTDSDIKTIIDEFVNHYKNNYAEFGKDLIWATDYDKERAFVYEYINKKRG